MPFRIDDDRGAIDPSPPISGKARLIIAAVVVVVIAIVATTITLNRRGDSQPAAPQPSPSVKATSARQSSPATPATPGATPSGGYTWPADTVLEEVAPGLSRCETSTSGLNDNAVNGIGYQWQPTMQGGIAAAMTHLQFRFGPAFLNDRTFKAVVAATTSDQLGYPKKLEAGLAAYRKDESLNAQGEIVDKTGKVNQGQAWLTAAYPRYGAYRVLSYTTKLGGQPDDLLVAVYLPVIVGPASAENVTDVKVTWQLTTMLMVWENNDWKAAAFRYAPDRPEPSDPTFVNQTFKERASTLGPGWCVTADASEKLLPGVVKGK